MGSEQLRIYTRLKSSCSVDIDRYVGKETSYEARKARSVHRGGHGPAAAQFFGSLVIADSRKENYWRRSARVTEREHE